MTKQVLPTSTREAAGRLSARPLAAADMRAAVAERFVEAARQHGRRAPCFFGVEDAAFGATRMKRLELSRLSTARRSFQRTGSAHRPSTVACASSWCRARAKGVAIRRFHAACSCSKVCRMAKPPPMPWWPRVALAPYGALGFVVDITPFRNLETHVHLAAEVEGELVAFVSVAPLGACNGWLIEDLRALARRHPMAAPKLLIDGVFPEHTRGRRNGDAWPRTARRKRSVATLRAHLEPTAL